MKKQAKTGAERARAYRRRRRAGKRMLQVAVPRDFIDATLWAGLLSEEDVRDKAALAEKLGDLLDVFVTHYDGEVEVFDE